MARFNVEMYNGIENEGPKEVTATVRYFLDGLPGFRNEMSGDPAKADEIIDGIWAKLIPALEKHDLWLPEAAKAAKARLDKR